MHLSDQQQQILIKLLLDFEDFFDVTLGDWQTEPSSFKLKEGTKPFYGQAFPVSQIYKQMLKKQAERPEELGVLKNSLNWNGLILHS